MSISTQLYLERIIENAQLAIKELQPEPPPAQVFVPAGADLRAALAGANGATVVTENGASFEGSYELPSKTRLVMGVRSRILATTAPALIVRPGTVDVRVAGGEYFSGHNDVVAIGENSDDQTTVESVPRDITLAGLVVTKHRGRRAYGLHGANITLDHCLAFDVFATSRQDSQGFYILNGPGPYRILGGSYSAGSEVGLIGGGAPKIRGLVPADILVDGAELFRPDSMRTTDEIEVVKNLFEAKTGKRIVVRNCRMHGCWKDGQSGYALTLTPASDGIKRPYVDTTGIVEDVLFENNRVLDVGGIFNILGRHYSAYTERPLSGVVIRNNIFSCDRVRNSGSGQLINAGSELHDIDINNNVILVDGSSLLYCYRGTVMEQDGTTHPGRNFGSVSFRDNFSTIGQYGINLDGTPNAANTLMVDSLDVRGNTFGGSTAMRKVLADNSYFDAATFEALAEVREARARLAAA